MKKTLFAVVILALVFVLASCEKDDYITGQRSPGVEIPQLSDKVEGRVVGTYVTWYKTEIPNPIFITHLNYAFAELYIVNGEYKEFKLQGSESRFKSIVDLKKQNPDLKILIAFSHTIENSDNTQAGGFSLLSKSDEARKKFAQDCKAFLQKWGIDGVDMDWEYPGLSWSGHASDPLVDVENHVLLMKQLRETLGPNYLLTYAGYVNDKQPVAGGGYKYIDIAAVAPYVDYVNIMAYDMSESPQHHSALKDPTAYADCDRAVQAYLNAGMPANKLVLGVPFYGRKSFSTSPTILDYKNILKLDPYTFKIDNWDEAASVPYVTQNGVYYCGYDNEKSIAIKGAWVLGKGMRGMMSWEYEGDDVTATLRTAMWEGVMKK